MAAKYKGITVEVGGETTKLDKALSGCNKSIRETQKELKQVEQLLKLDPKNTELLAQKQKLLAQSVEETRGKLDALKQAEKQMQEQVARGEASQKQYDELKREIIATEQQLKSLEQQAAESNSKLLKVADVTKSIGEKSEALGKKLLPLTAAITGVGVATGKLASDFNDAMAKASTLVDTNVQDMEVLKQGILSVSDETGIAAEQLAESMYNALSASVELGEGGADMMAFLKSNADLAKVGFTDIDTAVTATAKTLNAYGLEVSATDQIHKVLLQTQNLGITSVGELGQALAGVTPTAAAMGVSFEQVGASLATMTAQGTPTSQAVSQLNALISELGKEGTKSSDILKSQTGQSFKELMESGYNLADVLQIMQVNLSDDAKAISELMSEADKATGATKTFEEACAALGLSAEDVEGELINMFGSLNAGKAALALGGENAAKFTENLEGMTTAIDVVGVASDKMSTDSFNLGVALNQLRNVGIELGNALLNTIRPAFESLIEKVKEGTEWFRGLSDEQKEMVVKIGMIVAAIGPALIAFGKMAQGLSGIMVAVTKIGPAITKVKGIVSGLFTLIAANPIVAVIAAIIAAVILLYTKCEWFRDMVNEAFGAVKEAASGVIEKLKPIVQELGKSFQNLVSTVKPIIAQILEAVKGLITALQPVFEFIVTHILAVVQGAIAAFGPLLAAVGNAIDFISNIINAFMALIRGDFEGFGQYLKAALQNLVDFVSNIITAVVTYVVTFLQTFGVNVKEIFTAIWDGIVSIFTGVGQWFADRFNEAYTAVTTAFQNVGQWFGDRWQDIQNALSAVATWFQTMFQNAYNNVTRVFQAIGQWFAARWKDIQNALSTVATWFQTTFQNAYNNLTRVFQAIGQWFAARWKDIQNALSTVPTWFQTTFQNAYNNLTRIFQNIGQWFTARWQDIQNALSSVPTWFQTTFQNAYNNVTKAFQNIGQWFKARYDDITNIFKEIPNFFKGVFETAADNVKNAFSGVVDFFEGVANKIKGFFSGIADKIRDEIEDATSAANSAGSGSSRSGSSSSSGGRSAASSSAPMIPPDTPMMATGGRLRDGMAIVAEAGPELIEMVNGEAIVTPLTGGASNTPVSGVSGGGTVFNQTNKFYSPKALTPFETARLNRNATRRAVLALQGV